MQEQLIRERGTMQAAVLASASVFVAMNSGLFHKCFTEEQIRSLPPCAGSNDQDNKECYSQIIMGIRGETFHCQLPSDTGFRLSYGRRSACKGKYPPVEVVEEDGSLTCPDNSSSRVKCLRLLQTVSQCYSLIKFTQLDIGTTDGSDLRVLDPPKNLRECVQTECKARNDEIPEYRIMELLNPKNDEDARYFLPLINNVPIDCDKFTNETEVTPTYISHCSDQHVRRGPCVLSEYPLWSGIEVPTLPLIDGRCPEYYCSTGCRCIAEGSALEAVTCPADFVLFGLWNFPSKLKYEPKGKKISGNK